MYYTITIAVNTDSETEAYRVAKKVTALAGREKISLKGVEKEDTAPKEVTAKVFASDRKAYKTVFRYQENGTIKETTPTGMPSGENVTMHVDPGTDIEVVSSYGRATHFRTDSSFKDRIDILSESVRIRFEGKSTHNSFVVDSKRGAAHEMIREVCLAYGGMQGAKVFTENASPERKEVAA